MRSVLYLIDSLLMLYLWCVIISAVMSWLVAYSVVNPRNRLVYFVGDFLYRITEPALRPIRRWVPVLRGIDISPLILIILIIFARNLLFEYWPV